MLTGIVNDINNFLLIQSQNDGNIASLHPYMILANECEIELSEQISTSHRI